MYQRFRHNLLVATLLVLALSLVSTHAFAQHYGKSVLVKNLAPAKHVDPQLVNPWGLVYGPGSPFWISDQGSGLSTLYDGTGVKQSLVATVPPATGTGKGSPTGIVYNGSSEFQIMNWTSAFLFSTLDGTISGWSHFSPNNALIGVNNSGSGTSYTGLAITSKASGNLLYAADFAHNKVDVYNGTSTSSLPSPTRAFPLALPPSAFKILAAWSMSLSPLLTAEPVDTLTSFRKMVPS
jgi:uncharacterized protein (TIGR03118 family)